MISLFGLPLSSSVLFILAGVLVGHLLWYRDRTPDREAVDGLEDKYSKAKGSARRRKRDFVTIQREKDEQDLQLQKLRNEYQDLSDRKDSLDNQSQTMHGDLVRTSRELQTAVEDLDEERRRNQTIIDELREGAAASHQSRAIQ